MQKLPLGNDRQADAEISPAMLEAGEMALFLALGASSGTGETYQEAARQVYLAMRLAISQAPHTPTDASQQ